MQNHLIFLIIHASAGALALFSGIIEAFSNKQGIFQKLFLVSSIFSAIAGLGMICGICHGFSVQIGFLTLAILWLLFSYLLGMNIFKGDNKQARRWFIRALALALFFFTVRIWKWFFINMGATYTNAYSVAVWLGWIVNLLIVEYVILRRL